MTDGLAILQTTLLIGTFSIFVLGGSIKDVAMCCGVLKDTHRGYNATSATSSARLSSSTGTAAAKSALGLAPAGGRAGHEAKRAPPFWLKPWRRASVG